MFPRDGTAPRLAWAHWLLITLTFFSGRALAACAAGDFACQERELRDEAARQWNLVWGGDDGLQQQIKDLEAQIVSHAENTEAVLLQFQKSANSFLEWPMELSDEMVSRLNDGIDTAQYALNSVDPDFLPFVEDGCSVQTCLPFRGQLAELIVNLGTFLNLQQEIGVSVFPAEGARPLALTPHVDLSPLARLVSGGDGGPGAPGILLYPLYKLLSTVMEIQGSSMGAVTAMDAPGCGTADAACLVIASINELLERHEEAVRSLLPPGGGLVQHAARASLDGEAGSRVLAASGADDVCLEIAARNDPDQRMRRIVTWYIVSSMLMTVGEILEAQSLIGVEEGWGGVSVAITGKINVKKFTLLKIFAAVFTKGGRLNLELAKLFRQRLESCRERLNMELILCNIQHAGNTQSPNANGKAWSYEKCEDKVRAGESGTSLF